MCPRGRKRQDYDLAIAKFIFKYHSCLPFSSYMILQYDFGCVPARTRVRHHRTWHLQSVHYPLPVMDTVSSTAHITHRYAETQQHCVSRLDIIFQRDLTRSDAAPSSCEVPKFFFWPSHFCVSGKTTLYFFKTKMTSSRGRR